MVNLQFSIKYPLVNLFTNVVFPTKGSPHIRILIISEDIFLSSILK